MLALQKTGSGRIEDCEEGKKLCLDITDAISINVREELDRWDIH